MNGGFNIENEVQENDIGVGISRNGVTKPNRGGGVACADNLTRDYISASNNTLTINENTYTFNDLTKSYSDYLEGDKGNLYIINNASGEANGNILNLEGGTIKTHSFILSNASTVSNNHLNLKSGAIIPYEDTQISFRIVAGQGDYNGTVTGNEITINDGIGFSSTNQQIYAGSGSGDSSSVNYNKVNINGSTINGVICGGSGINVSNNEVNIYGGTISGSIYGGNSASIGTANYNVVNIYGNPILTSSTLYGGIAGASIGNELNIYTKGIDTQNVRYFQVINFYLDNTIENGNTLLTLTNGTTDLSNTEVNAILNANNSPLTNGNTVTLLKNENGLTVDADKLHGTVADGVTFSYDISVEQSNDGNSIIAKIGNASSGGNDNPSDDSGNTDDDDYNNPNPKISIIKLLPNPIPEPYLLPDIDPFPEFELDDNKKVDDVAKLTPKGWEIFGDAGGGSMRYKTGNGSHIDTTNQNIDLGCARNFGTATSKLTVAPIIDYQNTNYDSYLDDETHGFGNSKYTGGGIILRNMNRNGMYYEGSFRGGRTKTDFASNDLDTTGNFGTVTYDASATIINGHLKVGKYLRLDKNNLLDVYSFYYHTHQRGMNADLSSGEHYKFSSANSGRLRLGYRLTTKTSKISRVYTGLAYQYEHNSGVTATYKNYNTPKYSQNGSSGMLEIGWIVKPLQDNPWTVDINATGWVGNQRGVKAMAKVQKAF